MSTSKLKEIMEAPWLLLSCGYWATLATYQDLKVRYLSWRNQQVESECDQYKSKLEEQLNKRHDRNGGLNPGTEK